MSPRVAIVTGGNKGIGFAIARGLSKQFKVSDSPMLIPIPYVNTFRATHLLVDWVVFSTLLVLIVIWQKLNPTKVHKQMGHHVNEKQIS